MSIRKLQILIVSLSVTVTLVAALLLGAMGIQQVYLGEKPSFAASTEEDRSASQGSAVIQEHRPIVPPYHDRLLGAAVQAPAPFKEDRLYAALALDVSFPECDDPKTTLADVLDSVGKQWNLTFFVRGAAADQLLKLEVASPHIPAMSLPAEWVLWFVLQRAIHPEMGTVSYRVLKDRIQIDWTAWFAEQNLVPHRPSLTTPQLLARAKALREKLSRVVAFSGIDDSKFVLEDFLRCLRQTWGVKSICDDEAFHREGLSEVIRTLIADPEIPSMRTELFRVIDTVLQRIEIPSGANFVLLGDCLWIGTNEGFQRWGVKPEWPARARREAERK